ncbi:hypothetical protein [Buchananella hordeovulneris]|uniref:hypothetical protein n=1 Tax=Buchananella hordeovulneris TaxID=52770 RepID=UPI001C9E3987|nr:hypothetical protein [Buchananella hordeovulneris]
MSAVADFPTGEQIVAWTAQHTRRHARGPWALLGDIYISVLALAILAALVLPHLGRLTSAGPAATGLAAADPGWLMVGVACLGLLAALSPARRLGPLFLRPFEVAWWLGLPGERTGLFLPATRLVVGAARSFGTHVSLLSLDTRALGRMLAPRPQPPAAPARFRGLRAARGLPRPARVICAVAAADWLQLRRQSFRLAQVAISLLLAALPHLAPQLPRFQLVGCHLVAGLVLLLALAAPARQAWFDPSADHRWPVGPFTVAVGHLVVPVVGMTAWVAVTLGPRLGAAATRQEVEVAGRAFVLAGSPLGVVALVTLAGLAWPGVGRCSSPVFAPCRTSRSGWCPPPLVPYRRGWRRCCWRCRSPVSWLACPPVSSCSGLPPSPSWWGSRRCAPCWPSGWGYRWRRTPIRINRNDQHELANLRGNAWRPFRMPSFGGD